MRKRRLRGRPSSDMAMRKLEQGLAAVVSEDTPEIVGQGANQVVHAAKLVSTLGVFTPKQVVIKHNVSDDEIRHMRDLSAAKYGTASLLKVKPSGKQNDAIISRYALGSLEDQQLHAKLSCSSSPIQPMAYYSYLYKLTTQLAQSLTAQHAANKVHRDIKPHNVFLDENGNARIGDFGSMMDCPAGKHVKIRKMQSHHGTPYYNPLEIADPDKERSTNVSQATDIWALGVILGDLLGPQHSKALLHKSSYNKCVNSFMAAYQVYRVAKKHQSKQFSQRANRFSKALERLEQQLDHTAMLSEHQLLALLDDMATLMTTPIGMRPTAADIVLFMKPFSCRVAKTSLRFDDNPQKPSITNINLASSTPTPTATPLAPPLRRPPPKFRAEPKRTPRRRLLKHAAAEPMKLLDMKGQQVKSSASKYNSAPHLKPYNPNAATDISHGPTPRGARNRYRLSSIQEVIISARSNNTANTSTENQANRYI